MQSTFRKQCKVPGSNYARSSACRMCSNAFFSSHPIIRRRILCDTVGVVRQTDPEMQCSRNLGHCTQIERIVLNTVSRCLQSTNGQFVECCSHNLRSVHFSVEMDQLILGISARGPKMYVYKNNNVT
jgi:hypothetical protein